MLFVDDTQDPESSIFVPPPHLPPWKPGSMEDQIRYRSERAEQLQKLSTEYHEYREGLRLEMQSVFSDYGGSEEVFEVL